MDSLALCTRPGLECVLNAPWNMLGSVKTELSLKICPAAPVACPFHLLIVARVKDTRCAWHTALHSNRLTSAVGIKKSRVRPLKR